MKLSPLLQDDLRHLMAAEGWIELGDAAEAQAELAQVDSDFNDHPMVLAVRWRIHAKLKQWEECVEAARDLTQVAPNDADGWINHAYALHELKRTQEAWDALSPVAEKFPKVAIIPYNLACYACQLGNLPVAQLMLEVASKIDGTKRIKSMALKDKDLEPLWEQIRGA